MARRSIACAASSFYNASGSIKNNRIVGLNQGPGSVCGEGSAILAENGPFDGSHPNTLAVIVQANEIIDAQQFGIAAQGDLRMTIEGNRIQMYDKVAISRFGILVHAGATGEVEENSVTGHYIDGAGEVVGIHIFESSNSKVTNNVISEVSSGIFVQSWCLRAGAASRNTIVGNRIRGASYGMYIETATTASFSAI